MYVCIQRQRKEMKQGGFKNFLTNKWHISVCKRNISRTVNDESQQKFEVW